MYSSEVDRNGFVDVIAKVNLVVLQDFDLRRHCGCLLVVLLVVLYFYGFWISVWPKCWLVPSPGEDQTGLDWIRSVSNSGSAVSAQHTTHICS